MTRMASGTATIKKDLAVIDEKLVATPNELVTVLSKCIQATCVDMKRWGGLIRLQIFSLEWALKNKASLHQTAKIAIKLGEFLEARGLQSKAALVYAECAKHLLDARHPSCSNFFCNAGLAWKRDKDWENGEASYAAALENAHLQYDPLLFIKSSSAALASCGCAGKILRILTVRPIHCRHWGHSLLLPVSRHLLPATITCTGLPYLRQDLEAASTKRIRCVMSSIARESTSVEAMRNAIRKCANPKINQTFSSIVNIPGARTTFKRNWFVRNYGAIGDSSL